MKAVKKHNSIPVSEAKAKFLELIRKVEAGETIEITKGGELVARLVPSNPTPLFGFAMNVKVHGDLTKPLDLGWDETELDVKK